MPAPLGSCPLIEGEMRISSGTVSWEDVTTRHSDNLRDTYRGCMSCVVSILPYKSRGLRTLTSNMARDGRHLHLHNFPPALPRCRHHRMYATEPVRIQSHAPACS